MRRDPPRDFGEGPAGAGADADAAIPGMRGHLDGCSACAEDHESLRALLMEQSGSSP